MIKSCSTNGHEFSSTICLSTPIEKSNSSPIDENENSCSSIFCSVDFEIRLNKSAASSLAVPKLLILKLESKYVSYSRVAQWRLSI